MCTVLLLIVTSTIVFLPNLPCNVKQFITIYNKSIPRLKTHHFHSSFDESNPRSVDVALFINHKREFQKCPTDLVNSKSGQIRVLRADDLTNHADLSNKQLLCPDLKRHDVSDIANCHFNNHLSTGVVFTRSDLRQTQLEAMQHGFTALSDKFGHGAKTEDVFELFGQFETGAKNVIFGDDSARLVSQSNRVTGNNEDVYNQIHCVKQ